MKKNATLVRRLALAVTVLCAFAVLAWTFLARQSPSAALAANGASAATEVHEARVEASRPKSGGIRQSVTVPATVIAYESADLSAKVSGFLKSQFVDIGDRVHSGQVLAELDSPEYVKARDQAIAALDQAGAQVEQANARIITADAESAAAATAVKKDEADVLKYRAAHDFNEKQFKRMQDLVKQSIVEPQLVDEQESGLKAAQSAVESAVAAVESAKSIARSAAARIAQAKADAAAARANVKVAKANLDRAEVFVKYLTIVAPFDGVVTKRNFFRGDYISSADMQGRTPLLTVDRIDKVRVVFQVPDLDVTLVKPGIVAAVSIDSLPGAPLQGAVSRLASAEHSETRTMRAEIDLENGDHRLCHGMYGYVTIALPGAVHAMRLPLSALTSAPINGAGTIRVVNNGNVRTVKVRLGKDDGVETEVLDGLSPTDEVVTKQSSELADGTAVTVVSADEPPAPNNSKVAATPASLGTAL